MNSGEFNKYINKELSKEFDVTFKEHFWQVNSSRLKSQNILKTYNFYDLYEKVQNIVTLACFLLVENNNDRNSIKALEICARLLENMSNVDDCTLDKDYLKIISALCYDISGYQSNAYCLSKELEKYRIEENSLLSVEEDNKIIYQIILILQKRIPLAKKELERENSFVGSLFFYFKQALLSWYNFILELRDTNYIEEIHKSYIKCLNSNNIYITSLLQLLEIKIQLSDKRSIEKILINAGITINNTWKKYIKLLTNDYYSNFNIKTIEERHSVYEFWVSQICAVKKGLLSNNQSSFVIQMPTSAGKTFIAELFLLQNLIENNKNHVLYISPFNALSNEKEMVLGKRLIRLGYSVSNLPESYELDCFQEIITNQTDLYIATPEKIDLLLRSNIDFFSKISSIVIDEGHIIGDKGNRGQLLEFLLIRLKCLFPNISYLFISAVIPEINAKDFSNWLANDENKIITSKQFENDEDDWTPTRKLLGNFIYTNNGGTITFYNQGLVNNEEKPFVPKFLTNDIISYIEKSKKSNKVKKTLISASLAYSLLDNGQVLVFSGYPGRIIFVANEILELIKFLEKINGTSKLSQNFNSESYYFANKYPQLDSTIALAISYGIGIHYGDLPIQIRKSVERDYNRGVLKILICTNTIGQGINFPIKNLIFDNVYYNPGNKNSKLSHNDYRNLIGRAGRAEKETEGFILFVNNSYRDNIDFNDYLNCSANEIHSCLYPIIKRYLLKSITEDELEKNLSNLIDTYLIDLLIEENCITEEEVNDLINLIIEKSLFNVQLKREGMDASCINKFFNKIYSNFKNSIDQNDAPLYKKTGLSISTTSSMIGYIKNNKSNILGEETNINNILLLFLDFLSKNTIKEIIDDYKLAEINIDYSTCHEILLKWISGDSISNLLILWQNKNFDTHDYFIFESRGINYILPWLLNGFILVLFTILDLDVNIEKDIKYLPIFLKNGLPTNISCIAKSLGILSRETCIILENIFRNSSDSNFISWIANLNETEIKKFELPEWETNNILEVSKKICPSNNIQQYSILKFYIKGTSFNDEFKKNSLAVFKTSMLSLKRDLNNKYDPYAILVMNNQNPIGFIPKEYSPFLSTEIDLNEKDYSLEISNINRIKDYNQIEVIIHE